MSREYREFDGRSRAYREAYSEASRSRTSGCGDSDLVVAHRVPDGPHDAAAHPRLELQPWARGGDARPSGGLPGDGFRRPGSTELSEPAFAFLLAPNAAEGLSDLERLGTGGSASADPATLPEGSVASRGSMSTSEPSN